MKRTFTLLTTVCILASSALCARAEISFKRVLKLQGITFNVESENRRVGNTLLIVPSGLTEDSKAIEVNIAGWVTGAEVEDMNSDGSPEIYVFVFNMKSQKGTLVAYASNKKKSLSPISIPDLTNERGYRGNEQFAIVETSFVRRFPVYSGFEATGKTRQIEYKLKAGENGWNLVRGKTTEY